MGGGLELEDSSIRSKASSWCNTSTNKQRRTDKESERLIGMFLFFTEDARILLCAQLNPRNAQNQRKGRLKVLNIKTSVKRVWGGGGRWGRRRRC